MNTRTLADKSLRGSMTALVTPFRSGQVDMEAVVRLVDRQIQGGTDWLVPCGTTGESPTLTEAEFEAVAATVIGQAAGRCPVMVGTGSYCTAEAVRRTRHAAEAGADAALVVTPYYNRPTQEGLFRHFAAIAEAVDIPIVLYNVPVRTGVSLNVDTAIRLHERFPNVVAVKHATGSVDGVTEMRTRSDLTVLCGDDALTWPMMSLGASGVISVLSNLEPALMKALTVSAISGDRPAVLRYHARVHRLASVLATFGPNPVPIKTAMALRGLLAEEFRLPLCPVDDQARADLLRLIGSPQPAEAVAA